MSTADRQSITGPSRTVLPPTVTLQVAHAAALELSFELAHADVLRQMALDWECGRCTPAEHWLARNPELAAKPDTAVQIVYEEICLREERGDVVRSEEMLRRFPQWAVALRTLFDCHRLIRAGHGPPRFPQEGQRLGELHLVQKIGRGALGQVYLATQPSLSDRPLVVKLTPCSGDEHLSLARLQHTHIVPLYLVQDFPDANLRALCMPYLGGLSWGAVLTALASQPHAARSGARVVELLRAAADRSPVATPRSGPALGFLSRATYELAVCWIGACLADALHYAHERGLVHLDVKPTNVLITGDGQPMLLDFHLARAVLPAGGPPPSRLGGTRGYMSPEQELAAAAVREGRNVRQAVDGRSDVYSLGVMLYESLAGRLPDAEPARSRRELRQRAGLRSRGLEDVIHKCLARDPADRYATAAQLAADLRRHLADLPLSGVPNRSVSERWRKWRRRKPHALAVLAAVAVAATVTSVLAAAFYADRVGAARAALAESEQHATREEFATAVDRLEDGQKALRWIPGQAELKRQLASRIDAARQGRRANAVHKLVEQLRFLDGLDSMSPAELARLDAGCAAVWDARTHIVRAPAGTSAAEQASLRADLADLAISWAALRMRIAAPGDGSDRRAVGARRLLDEAESLCGPSFALALAREEFSGTTGAERAAALPTPLPEPRTAFDHFALGRFLFRADRLQEARDRFQRAVELEPGVFWPYFYLSQCAYRLDDLPRALAAAGVCVALEPQAAPCFYNRAVCRQALQQAEAALADFDRAIALDPALAVAWLRRGMLHAELGRQQAALADFGKALENGANPEEVYVEMARLALAAGDPDAARSHVAAALAVDPHSAPARALQAEFDAGQ
jgi:serine/threonine protein kinase/tetratricopeptide (TPR) repeat protein